MSETEVLPLWGSLFSKSKADTRPRPTAYQWWDLSCVFVAVSVLDYCPKFVLQHSWGLAFCELAQTSHSFSSQNLHSPLDSRLFMFWWNPNLAQSNVKKTNHNEKLEDVWSEERIISAARLSEKGRISGNQDANSRTRSQWCHTSILHWLWSHPPPRPLPSSPQAAEDGGGKEGGYISPTRHPSIHLAVGWLQEEKKGRERTKRTGGGGGEGVDVKREEGRQRGMRTEEGGCRLEKTEARKRRRRM